MFFSALCFLFLFSLFFFFFISLFAFCFLLFFFCCFAFRFFYCSFRFPTKNTKTKAKNKSKNNENQNEIKKSKNKNKIKIDECRHHAMPACKHISSNVVESCRSWYKIGHISMPWKQRCKRYLALRDVADYFIVHNTACDMRFDPWFGVFVTEIWATFSVCQRVQNGSSRWQVEEVQLCWWCFSR